MPVALVRTVSMAIACGLGLVLSSPPDPPPSDLPGLHNIHQVMPGVLSGSSPEGDAGFASLQKLGVKTIISVDGSKPDVDRARKLGMRYVHLPIGYNAVPHEQGLRIARAIRDLPGLVFIHCHHGKHRGPAAAAVAKLCLDETCAIETAIEFMKKAGTDKRYQGLFASVRALKRPSKADLDKAPADFPEATKVSALARAMVEIDERWENLKLAKKARWQTPPDHPDIDPPHEASILRERFHEGTKASANAELKAWLTEAWQEAQDLENALRKPKNGEPVDAAVIDRAFLRVEKTCSRCHDKHRDAP